MRTEEEMMRLILGFARDRGDVRAVIMTGSRTNPAATRDRFQDYDITYVVEDLAPYRRNPQVPKYFGDIMILQNPDEMGEAAADPTSYAYLMQFMDGNRIDLTFRPTSDVDAILADSLSLALVDKDGRFELASPTLRSYLPTRPTAKQFADCCNEFWWLNPYIAKGLCRDEIPYAKAMLEDPLRKQLMRMLTWYLGLNTNFQVTVGLAGKHLKRHLADNLWELLERTYCDARPDNIWEALFAMEELFRSAARFTAEAFGFVYCEREDAVVSFFVREIRDQVSQGGKCNE